MKKRKTLKSMALLLTMVLVVSCMAACGKSENTIHLAIMRTGFTLPLQYAVEQGYFEEMGLDVEVQYFDNGPQINEAIAAGDVDVAGIGEMPSITGAIANKSKVVAWMEDDEASIQAYARKDSDIVKAGKGNLAEYPEIYGTAQEWRGKNIICAKGTSSHYGLLATLEALGLTEEDVTITDMEGSKGATTFASGTGDIFFGFDPQWSEFWANSNDYVQVATCENAGRSLCCVLIASEAFTNANSEDLTKFIQAMMKAEEELRVDENKYYSAMYDWQSFYGKATEELAKYSAQIKPLRSLEEQEKMFKEENGTSEILNSYETVIDFMVKNKVITEADKQTFYDNKSIDATYMYKAIENLRK